MKEPTAVESLSTKAYLISHHAGELEARIAEAIGQKNVEIAKLQDRLTAMADRSENKDQRIAELETRISNETKQLCKEVDVAEKRITELEAQLHKQTEQWRKKWELSCETLGNAIQREHAMAALLDRVSHIASSGVIYSTKPIQCAPDCPACAWSKLKGGE